MVVILIVMLITTLFLGIKLYQTKQQIKTEEAFFTLQEKLANATKAFQELNEQYKNLSINVVQLETTISHKEQQFNTLEKLVKKEDDLLQEKRNKAIELAKQDAELVKAKYQQQLNEQLQQLKSTSELEKYQRELNEAKAAWETLQKQREQTKNQEDFNARHSLEIDEEDRQEILVIEDVAKRIRHKEVLRKLIWSTFYQKPLQDLRKLLEADKKTGIYKITNKQTQQCYIGQACDIGERWAQHIKTGLGILSSSYLTNKFYKSLHKEGPQSFTFEILEECNKDNLDSRETYYIDLFSAVEYGYNSRSGTGGIK